MAEEVVIETHPTQGRWVKEAALVVVGEQYQLRHSTQSIWATRLAYLWVVEGQEAHHRVRVEAVVEIRPLGRLYRRTAAQEAPVGTREAIQVLVEGEKAH